MRYHLYNPLRYWNDQPDGFPTLDRADAEADREDSLSERYAFQLGEDLGLCRMEPSAQWPSDEMAKGHAHGRKRAPKHANVYLRKLLRLRVNAYARRLPFSSAITMDYLRAITVTVCPVSGVPLTQGMLADTDWSVDRLHNGLGYVPGNICFMSTRVNAIKGAADFDELLAGGAALAFLGGRAALEQPSPGGLLILEVLRLASLVAAPASIAKSSKFREFPPVAMAPGVWVTPHCKMAGLHVACARSRLETTTQRLRRTWFKRLGATVWRTSNKLVERIRSQLATGTHPCDLWLDLECMSMLLEVTDAFFENPPPLPGRILPETAFQTLNAQLRTVSTYAR
ncbi:MAG: hypothetical protein ABI589_12490 [Burkholderiales bacterium]